MKKTALLSFKTFCLFPVLFSLSFIAPENQNANNETPYYVYSEGFDNGIPSGIMGANNGAGLEMDAQNTENPLKGDYCLKVSADGTEAWSGVFIQKGGNWKTNVPKDDQLSNLNGNRYLVFSARADSAYNIAKVGMGEGKEESEKGESGLALGKEWKRFVFELSVADRSRINGLFLIVFENAGTVYFDEIYYAGADFVKKPEDTFFGERAEALDTNSFYVFSDKWDNGVPTGFMGDKDGASIKMDDNSKENPYLGPKCLKIEVVKGETWRGLHIHASGAWNEAVSKETKLPDLREYDKLEFYARSDSREYLLPEVGVGAGGFEDKRSDTFLEVGKKWRRYQISLKGTEFSRVNTLFYFTLPEGTIYFDEIRFIKKESKK